MKKYLLVFLVFLGCGNSTLIELDGGIQYVDGGIQYIDGGTITEPIFCNKGTYEGDIKIFYQSDVLKYIGYTSVTEDLEINCEDCTDLKYLGCLKSVGDYFLIAHTQLDILQGLENIDSIEGNLCIYHNHFLSDCEVCSFLDQLDKIPSQAVVYDNINDDCSPAPNNC